MSCQSCELELDSVDFFAMQGGGVRAYREYVRRRQRSSAKKSTLAKLRFNFVKTLIALVEIVRFKRDLTNINK